VTPQERNGLMLESLWQIGETIMRGDNKGSAIPRYHRFSPYNFVASDFLAAARRFIELRERWSPPKNARNQSTRTSTS
jgi:hypothetical protein